MEAFKVGIANFERSWASYLLESDVPVAITRHGGTVGYTFLPDINGGPERAPSKKPLLAAGVLASEGFPRTRSTDFKVWHKTSGTRATGRGFGSCTDIHPTRKESNRKPDGHQFHGK